MAGGRRLIKLVVTGRRRPGASTLESGAAHVEPTIASRTMPWRA
jgi:hypothetical protein